MAYHSEMNCHFVAAMTEDMFQYLPQNKRARNEEEEKIRRDMEWYPVLWTDWEMAIQYEYEESNNTRFYMWDGAWIYVYHKTKMNQVLGFRFYYTSGVKRLEDMETKEVIFVLSKIYPIIHSMYPSVIDFLP